MPILRALLDPEQAHKFAIWAAKHGLVPSERGEDDAVLQTEVWGRALSNPLGLAAGFDKNAEAVDALLGFGFGMVEIGSVTPLAQVRNKQFAEMVYLIATVKLRICGFTKPGNPQPRMFRLSADKAVINRYGFNSDGIEVVEQRLKSRIRKFLHRNRQYLTPESGAPAVYPVQLPKDVPHALREGRLLGVNLGKNKVSLAESNADYVKGITQLGPFADYLVVNISSPNTPGLRALQRREPIRKLLQEVKRARDQTLPHLPPLLVKIAPDLGAEELKDIAAVVESVGIDGMIISNTTISRPATLKSGPKLTTEMGGLSGPPLHTLSLKVVRDFYKLTNGRVPIVGCGGVQSADEMLAFGRAGASLVQVYSAMSYDGPGLVTEIKTETARRLREEGKTWMDIVGSDHR
ncbi:Dihydroorotate dehydrogenase (quinone), mitochondrial [Thoreauomyces humboldtii]|nr:Dihydroorotate dehydrogenase (quinone), mitochondrial [Thoreauomyces humboldtii]